MGDLMKFLNARRDAYRTDPKLIDEAIYTTYGYQPSPPPSDAPRTGDLLGISELNAENPDSRPKKRKGKFYAESTEAEVFLFEYGTVVIWGMTESQEKRFLSSM
jgi:uncharacterized Rmd1/YagE family protein